MNSLSLKYRNKETEEENHKIYNIIGDKITINQKYKIRRYYPDDCSTLFNEVEIVPYYKVIPQEWIKTLEKIDPRQVSKDVFLDGLIEALKTHIEKTWSKKKHHLIQHSAGWDSRVLSSLIHQIYEERGDNWLGKISFVCWGEECKILDKILKAEGWEDHLATCLVRSGDRFFETNFDFKTAWKKLNGYASYPINHPIWAFDEMQKLGKIPKETDKIQIWAASFFNELLNLILKPTPPSLEEKFFKKYYYCVYADFVAVLPCEFIQPLLNTEIFRFILKNKIKFNGELRPLLVKRLNKALIKIPRIDSPSITVPLNHFMNIRKDYINSWYYKNTHYMPRDLSNLITFSNWWSMWSTASFIEHLINNGVIVKCR